MIIIITVSMKINENNKIENNSTINNTNNKNKNNHDNKKIMIMNNNKVSYDIVMR